MSGTENEKTEEPSLAIKFVRVGPLLLGFAAAAATPLLTLQQISLSTSSETVINA